MNLEQTDGIYLQASVGVCECAVEEGDRDGVLGARATAIGR